MSLAGHLGARGQLDTTEIKVPSSGPVRTPSFVLFLVKFFDCPWVRHETSGFVVRDVQRRVAA